MAKVAPANTMVPMPVASISLVTYRPKSTTTPCSGRIRTALQYLAPLRDCDGVEIRLHATPMYNSPFRFDDDMFVTPHLYGPPAVVGPQVPGTLSLPTTACRLVKRPCQVWRCPVNSSK
jgi:hypothetical protein